MGLGTQQLMFLQGLMKKRANKYVFGVILLLIGFCIGAFLFPLVVYHLRHQSPKDFNINDLFSQSLVDIRTGKPIEQDVFQQHERNLLVFWSPACSFCRKFFQNSLNAEEIGIFCFPLTDDFEYVNFFVEEHRILYNQIGTSESDNITPIDAPFIDGIPTFIVLDKQGNVIDKKIGIKEMDSLIEMLYSAN